MSIDWGFIDMVAKREAAQFANKYQDSNQAQAAYNAYLAGRMQCAAERESLRSILERKDKALCGGPAGAETSHVVLKEKSDITDNSLDDLI